MPPLYDAHDHLQDAWLAPHRAQMFAELTAAGVQRTVVNGTCETDWAEVAALAQSHALVLPSYGLHPWDAGNRSSAWQQALKAQLDADPDAVIGEIGLDRWILDRARPEDPRLAGLRRASIEEQTDVFLWQLTLAAERGLPASLHCLDAFGLMYDTLRSAARPPGFLLHAYSGPAEMVAGFAQLGAYFSFNGSFLHPRRQRLKDVFAAVPADRLLVETDAPAMRLPAERETFPPFPADDGAWANHPANLAAAYTGLAEWRQVEIAALAAQVEENFQRLFGARNSGAGL